MPSASWVWGAEADTSRHVSPGCALAGASYLLCADSIWRLGVLHMCFILLAPGKILSLHYAHYPEPWLMKSHLQPCPQDWSTVHQLSFCSVEVRKPQEHREDLVLSNHTSPPLSSRGSGWSRLQLEFQTGEWSTGLPADCLPCH